MIATLFVLLVAQGPPVSMFGEDEPYERISPSGEVLLHVDVRDQRARGPCRAVLVRDGELAWARELPFTPTDAVVSDRGWVVGLGWPGGRPSTRGGSATGWGSPRQRVLLVLDERGRLARERHVHANGDVTEVTDPSFADGADVLEWAESVLASGGFAALGTTRFDQPQIPLPAPPTAETIHVRGTPLRALRWKTPTSARVLVVDLDFQPVLGLELARAASAHSLAGGLLAIEGDRPAPYALAFERTAQWIARHVEADELALVQEELRTRAREVRQPLARVALGVGPSDSKDLAWVDSCVTADGLVAVVEGMPMRLLVFDPASGEVVTSAVPPAEQSLASGNPHGLTVARAPGGVRVRFGASIERDGLPYVRYAVPAGTGVVEQSTSTWLDSRPAIETWYPFGGSDARWVQTLRGLRLREGEAWASPLVSHDAWGRAIAGPVRVGVSPHGALAVLDARREGADLTLTTRDGEPVRTVPLPAGTGARDPFPYDGTHAWLVSSGSDAAAALLVVDTRDDSFRNVALEGVESLRNVDLHLAPGGDELWLVDRSRHELVRFAL